MLVNELHQGGIRALLDYDNTIFDSMQLPEGVDLADVVDHILYKYGDAPLFSPDPSVVKFYIGRWSKRRLPLWERYKAAIELEYNPIENYDRQELERFTHGKSVGHTGTITDATSGTITDQPSGVIKVERDDTSTDNLSADNSSTYQPDSQNILDGETKTSYQDYKEERSFNQYQEQRTFGDTESASGTDTKDSRIHGNIGVTTSQQMLTSELDLIPRLDLIDYIAEDWHSEFNMMMYL